MYTIVPIDDTNRLEGINTFAHLFIAYQQELHPDWWKQDLKQWNRMINIMNLAETGEYRLWLVRDEESEGLHEAVGMAGLSTENELSPSWVHPDHRGHGIHQQLIEARVKAGGTFSVAHKDNHACIHNLEKYGFKHSGETRNTDFLLYRKMLVR